MKKGIAFLSGGKDSVLSMHLAYNNGIRIGKWYWKDKNGNKILEGKFNNEGNPVDLWENYGIDEVLTFSDDGSLIGTMKTRIKD